MGRRGPPKKPRRLSELEGNPGHRPLPDVPEPTIAARPPKCPAWVCPRGKTIWRRCAAPLHKLGLLTEIDADSLASYCHSFGRYLECEEQVTKEGILVEVINNKCKKNMVRNPAIAASKQYLDSAMRIAARFGLTPSDRMALGTSSDDDGDPLTMLAKAKLRAQQKWQSAAGA